MFMSLLLVLSILSNFRGALMFQYCLFYPQTWCKYNGECDVELKSSDKGIGALSEEFVNSQCVNQSNQLFMKIKWNSPTTYNNLDYYQLIIKKKNDRQYKVCFNASTSTSFDFTKELSFEENKSYRVAVRAVPTDKKSSVINYTELGSCPRRGEWATWGKWGDCCSCEPGPRYKCSGTRTSTRKCLTVTHKAETEDYECEGELAKRERCEKQCVVLSTTKKVTLSTTTTTIEKDDPGNSNFQPKNIGFLIGGVSAGLLVIGFLYLVHRKRKHICWPKMKPIPRKPIEEIPNVYISHLSHASDRIRILKLAHYIQSFDLKCVVDLLCTVELHNMGGLPHWIPYKMQKANKIIVVLSKLYIKALNSLQDDTENFPEEVCKVHTEFSLIRTIMYHSCQRSPQLVIVLDGVKKEDVPDIFRGRHHCLFPSTLNDKMDSCRELIGLLLDINHTQLASSQI